MHQEAFGYNKIEDMLDIFRELDSIQLHMQKPQYIINAIFLSSNLQTTVAASTRVPR